MAQFEDIRTIIDPRGVLSVKLCRINNQDYFDFRHLLQKDNGETVPTKNGLCLRKEHINDFALALAEVLFGSREKKVGPCIITRRGGRIWMSKGSKMCSMNFEDCNFVMKSLDELET